MYWRYAKKHFSIEYKTLEQRYRALLQCKIWWRESKKNAGLNYRPLRWTQNICFIAPFTILCCKTLQVFLFCFQSTINLVYKSICVLFLYGIGIFTYSEPKSTNKQDRFRRCLSVKRVTSRSKICLSYLFILQFKVFF